MEIKNCSIPEFVGRVNHRPVIAIGVGSELMDWSEKEDKQYGQLVNTVTYFVDNDSKKWGKTVEVFGRVYKIFSLQEIMEMNLHNAVFVITCMAYIQIIEQLSEIPMFQDAECYYSVCMKCSPEMDLDWFINVELKKDAMVFYKERLRQKKLKNKYQGRRCFIIGNGPSLRAEDLDRLQNEISFASNFIFKIYDRTKWRPTFYAMIDYYVLDKIPDFVQENKSSTILIPRERAIASGKVYDEVLYFDRKTSYVRASQSAVEKTTTQILFSDDLEEGTFGGDTVTYDMMQMAVYMGFSEIYLLGMDHTMPSSGKAHFYEKELVEKGLEYNMQLMTQAYRVADEAARERGTHIYNATRGGRLEVFPRVAFDSLFEE